MEGNKNISIIIISLILVILLLIGASYAYFSKKGESSEKKVTTGTVGIKYTDNIDTVTIDNIIPIYDTEIKTKANKFSFNIENLGNATTYVDMSLTNIVIDESLKDLEFKWALYSGEEKNKQW